MPNVLIRDVPGEDLEPLRAAAAERGMSLQVFLREAVHAHAVHVRRRSALARTAQRLQGRPSVPEAERQAVLDAIDAADDERATSLTDRPAT